MAEFDMTELERYENNYDLLTDELILGVKKRDRIAEWKLLMIFKGDILKAGNKLAKTLSFKLGRPNNGLEVEWLVRMERNLIRCYRTNYRLGYWEETGVEDCNTDKQEEKVNE